ncbi:MAG: rhodanese-like domain-containing protein [Desulfovibrio sp.]|jgi:rhodanese-related sulfurtransferase
MDGAADLLATTPGGECDAHQELERKRLNQRVLLEMAQELSGILQPRKLLDAFLLTAMGPTGATQGMAVLANPTACDGLILTRGLPEDQAAALEQRLPAICDAYFPYSDHASDFSAPILRFIRRDEPTDSGLLPEGMDTLLCFSVDESHCGLLGVGPFLGKGGSALGKDTEDLLHSLTHILIGVLRGALAVSNIRQLSVDLGRKNEQLTKALDASQAAQRALDRRVYQLAAINELAGELSHRHRMSEILDGFLLTMLGAFSVSSGLVLVLDRAAHAVEMALRGAPNTGLTAFPAADRLVYRAFGATGPHSVAPLTVDPVISPRTALSDCGLTFEPACAVYFALNSDVQGVLVLGKTISGEELADEDEQLVRAQLASMLGYIQGARHLETITSLNADLVRHNEELTRTVKELTEARQTIDLLERAGERVRSFLQAEAKRSRRFSWLDCGIILAAAMLMGFLFNLASPNGVPLVPEHLLKPSLHTITAQKAREMQLNEDALIVDARPQAFYDQQRISGAVNLTPGLFDLIYLMNFSHVPLSRPIIVYGGNISRRWDDDVAARLTAREHERVLVLRDGLSAWVAHGYKVEP